MLLCLSLAVALAPAAQASPDVEAAAVPGKSTADAGIETLVLQIDGMDTDGVEAAVRLRAPELRVVAADIADFDPPEAKLFAYGLVHPKADVADAWSVTVIFSDGRAFFRTIRADADTAPRVLATTLVNLVRSGEQGTIEPDATQSLPDFSGPQPPPTKEPVEPAPPPGPDVRLGLQGALVTGLGPPTDADIIVGGAGGLEVGVRMPKGVVFTMGARVATRTRRGHRMLRVQASAAAGYSWRWRAFELVALGYVSVEPWFLLASAGREATRTAQPEDSSSPVLLGGGGRLSPGYRIVLSPKHAVRLGLRVEAGGSAMARGGIGRITTQAADGSIEPLFRLGGFELATGVELVWCFGTTTRG